MGGLGARLAAGVCVLALTAGSGSPRLRSQQPPKSPACSTPEYHQFDFWIGDWDAFDADKPGTLEARLRVDRLLDGCVIHEDYQDVHGHKGQSFSIYDASRRMWHQTWLTNRGELLLLDGEFRKDEMVLHGHDTHDGKPREIRGIWKRGDDGVRESADESFDDGKKWTPWFDLIFRPHLP